MPIDPDVQPLLDQLQTQIDALRNTDAQHAQHFDTTGAHISALHSADKALERQLTALAERVGVLEQGTQPPPPPSWQPRFPGDTRPGTIRWGAGGGNDSRRADEHEAAAGVPMGAWRLFYQMSQVNDAVAKCSEAISRGRVPVLSMKPGTSWTNAGKGAIDSQMRVLFDRLGALPGPVWFIMHHEPEGGGGSGNSPDDPGGAPAWRAMQARVRQVLNASTARNIAFGPCLMGFTWSTQSGRNPEDWWVPGIWDFYGFDVYQSTESGAAPTKNASWQRAVEWSKAKGLPVMLGELGNRGNDATAGRELREVYEDLCKVDCIGSTYFDTSLNSGPAPYTLTGEPLRVFRELIADPRSITLKESL